MAWINGFERKRFDEEQKRLAEEYRIAGMTNEQIEQMYQFDLETFNVDLPSIHNNFQNVFWMRAAMISRRFLKSILHSFLLKLRNLLQMIDMDGLKVSIIQILQKQ